MTDQAALLDGFLQDRVDPANFDHRAHVLVSLALLRQHDLPQAAEIYCRPLRRLTERAGVPDKFDAALTGRAMALIARRARAADSASDFVKRNPDLLDSARFITAPNEADQQG